MFWGNGLGLLSAERRLQNPAERESTIDQSANLLFPADRDREDRATFGMCGRDVEERSNRDTGLNTKDCPTARLARD